MVPVPQLADGSMAVSNVAVQRESWGAESQSYHCNQRVGSLMASLQRIYLNSIACLGVQARLRL